jgi:hypothetical protein
VSTLIVAHRDVQVPPPAALSAPPPGSSSSRAFTHESAYSQLDYAPYEYEQYRSAPAAKRGCWGDKRTGYVPPPPPPREQWSRGNQRGGHRSSYHRPGSSASASNTIMRERDSSNN